MAAVLALCSAATAQPRRQAQAAAAAQPTLLGQYGEWGAYTGSSNGRKVCFALAKPSTSETKPPNRPRDPAFLFISTRPAENVRNEVSVIIGYTFKPSSDAVVEVGSTKFAMQTQADGAWIKNAAEEPRLLDALRKASDMVVRGTSAKGTETMDRYSLKGLGQAIDRVAQECR
jgi:invasion protein IalB